MRKRRTCDAAAHGSLDRHVRRRNESSELRLVVASQRSAHSRSESESLSNSAYTQARRAGGLCALERTFVLTTHT